MTDPKQAAQLYAVIRKTILTASVLLLSGCAIDTSHYKSAYELGSAPLIPLADAEHQAINLINKSALVKTALSDVGAQEYQFQPVGLVMVNTQGEIIGKTITYQEMDPKVEGSNWHAYDVHVCPECKTYFGYDDVESSEKLADLLYVIKHRHLNDLPELKAQQDAAAAAAQKAFQDQIDWYHAQNPKPPLPEEARKYGVQAEAAVEQKKYHDAIALYQKAFGIAPWWPQGHYNLAMVRVDQKDYGQAIAEMKKYLLLEPNAADARQAQDQIYQWEAAIATPKAVPAQ